MTIVLFASEDADALINIRIMSRFEARLSVLAGAIACGRDVLEEFRQSVADLKKLVSKTSWRSEWIAPPPYVPTIAPVAGGRSACAPLARGKLKRWRSLKEKRRAWGIS